MPQSYHYDLKSIKREWAGVAEPMSSKRMYSYHSGVSTEPLQTLGSKTVWRSIMETSDGGVTGCAVVDFQKRMIYWTNSKLYNFCWSWLFVLIIVCVLDVFTAQAAAPEQVLSAQELQKRSDALDHREQSLNSMEADLNSRVAKLKDLEAILQKMLDEAKAVKDSRIQKLIDVYTSMKPQQAAIVMETIDVPLAVKVLAGMKSQQAGQILNKMSKNKAATISEELIKLQAGPDLPKKP